MKKVISSFLFSCFLLHACAQDKNDKAVGDACEDCAMMYEDMPSKLSPATVLAAPGERGEPLIIRGTIYKKDGHTPAPGVILYVYHTDSEGKYTPASGQKAARRHGHLRGWIKTGPDGKYSFTTIRPVPYPAQQNPAHIHPLIKEPGLTLYWIDEYLFDDDPYVTANVRSHQDKRGGPGIIHLTKNAEGIWVGERNITLGLNIPNYPSTSN